MISIAMLRSAVFHTNSSAFTERPRDCACL